jgi:predicted nucleic acid-binding protein
MEWEAVGAVATSAATLVALLLGGSAEWRARKAENRLEADRAARARIEEEHQARRVAAWISAEPKRSFLNDSGVAAGGSPQC